ncbi:MAG: CCA tRNA nucleotidyltransferase [Eggerthellaceae bacterium]
MAGNTTSIRLPRYAEKALETIESAGFEAWIVGGFVRDSLMGNDPGDLDIASSAPWEQAASAFRNAGAAVFETGVKHGTITAVIEGSPIEVTTYRADGQYSDGRHPDSVCFVNSIEEDLARRDFTMNAIAYHPARGLLDPFDGQCDIENRLIRCVGDPRRRLSEDALRILRAVRFSAQLGFAIEEGTRIAMGELAGGLAQVAEERKAAELQKLLCSEHAGDCLMENMAVIGQVIPELAPLQGFDQMTPFHCYDALEHTARVVDLVDRKPTLRWAALLHDVGKPDTFTIDEAGQGHFKGHPAASARIARGIAHRLRLPKERTRDMLTLIKLHDSPIIPKKDQVKHAIHELGDRPGLLADLISLKLADATARTPLYSGPRVRTAGLLEGLLEEILENGEAYSLAQLDISGSRLIDAGVPAGPWIGRLLEECLDAVIDGKVPNEEDELVGFALSRYDGNLAQG